MERGPRIIRHMIRFSQSLQNVLASTGWPQKELARRAGVSATNVSRWLGCKGLPDRQALGKVIEVLPEELAPPLIAAWVYDALPPNADRLVGIVSKNPSSKVEEVPPDEWPSELNRTTRRKFIDFSRLATRHPDVMEIVNVLHAAAMRAASTGSKLK
jgi:transcriptional regulator with XRE-family HTH domain